MKLHVLSTCPDKIRKLITYKRYFVFALKQTNNNADMILKFHKIVMNDYQ